MNIAIECRYWKCLKGAKWNDRIQQSWLTSNWIFYSKHQMGIFSTRGIQGKLMGHTRNVMFQYSSIIFHWNVCIHELFSGNTAASASYMLSSVMLLIYYSQEWYEFI